MYPVVYFREYPVTRLWSTYAITDTLSPLVDPHNEGLLYTSNTLIKQSILFRYIIAIYSENRTKHVMRCVI
jgi:hypothetical protein